MRYLLLSQYFWPDLSGAAQMMSDLAEDLAARGAQVRVVTGRCSYAGQGALVAAERWRGVAIERVASTCFGRERLIGRGLDFASFLAAATVRVLAGPEVDLIVTVSTPPFLPLVGLLQKRLAGTRFVYWVQDLYPEIAVKLGVLPAEGVATRMLEALSRATLRGADAVVAIGDCMAERIAAKGFGCQQVEVVHNWADGEAIVSVPRADNWFLDRHALRDQFVVLYSGNLGRGHAFETLLGAARALRSRDDIAFVFIGMGPRLAEAKRASRGFANVRFLPYQQREDLAWSLGAADLAAITLRDDVCGLMVPSKLYGHLASARPILFIGPRSSTVARVIEAARCGAVFSHGDIDGVREFIEALAKDRARAAELGTAARRAFEERYGRSTATGRLAQICEAAVHRSSEARASDQRGV
jgi:colanic acid biosynthesis glycosyl transferase WcaI